ncbi:MAG TPA: ADP-forming succinate--CoA ligase subunit beta [Gammaproteobacteria bacterium]
MNLHEYQAKRLLTDYGIPIPRGAVARTTPEATSAARELGGTRWVLKAQVHAGGRGKAGGIQLVDNLAAVEQQAGQLLGSRLVTGQSAAEGLPVEALLIEEPLGIARELYLGALVDRVRRRVVVMASASGGMDIEEVAAQDPSAILTEYADPAAGLQPYQCRKLAFGLGLQGDLVNQFTRIVLKLAQLFQDKDLSLVEINPLVVTEDNRVLALDCKINLDDNALYRQKLLADWRDPNQEEIKERTAHEHGLNYVTLDGNIACMVNGAGLAMATMDLIKLHGGEPANFLDVGGGATADKVAEAFKLILSDKNVRAILVNIFGGIVRCDLIAEGIIQAVREVDVHLPVVVRLEGTNVERGRELLANSGLSIIAADDLTDAAQKAVAAVKSA